jgi:hypothetical protein
MKFAIADPPYVGCAHLYPEKTEVDHAALIARLELEYPDGWLLCLVRGWLDGQPGPWALAYLGPRPDAFAAAFGGIGQVWLPWTEVTA